MKTLREEWTDFFSENIAELNSHYPGLSLKRFLMEVQDILVLKTHPRMQLDLSSYNVPKQVTHDLRTNFLRGVPFAYLTGFTDFYGLRFATDKSTLIPRNETELLVDLLSKSTFQRGLDIGTGSGVIMLSLLASGIVKEGVASDISEEALKLARSNARKLRLRCEFIRSDRFEHIHGNFDLIVSNPPYIKKIAHQNLVHKQVAAYEPETALYLPDDEYEEWFNEFFKESLVHLNPGGTFLMEGHELELKSQSELLRGLGFSEVKVLQDYAGFDRFLLAKVSLGHG